MNGIQVGRWWNRGSQAPPPCPVALPGAPADCAILRFSSGAVTKAWRVGTLGTHSSSLARLCQAGLVCHLTSLTDVGGCCSPKRSGRLSFPGVPPRTAERPAIYSFHKYGLASRCPGKRSPSLAREARVHAASLKLAGRLVSLQAGQGQRCFAVLDKPPPRHAQSTVTPGFC